MDFNVKSQIIFVFVLVGITFFVYSSGTLTGALIESGTFDSNLTEEEFTVIEPSRTVVCGDGFCDIAESSFSCSQDCAGATEEQKLLGVDLFVPAVVVSSIVIITIIVIFFFFVKPRFSKKQVTSNSDIMAAVKTEENVKSTIPDKEKMLEAYVSKQFKTGFTKKQISQKLIDVGWNQSIVASVVRKAKK